MTTHAHARRRPLPTADHTFVPRILTHRHLLGQLIVCASCGRTSRFCLSGPEGGAGFAPDAA